jgi:hypothetical protein
METPMPVDEVEQAAPIEARDGPDPARAHWSSLARSAASFGRQRRTYAKAKETEQLLLAAETPADYNPESN